MLKQEIIKYLENPGALNEYNMSELSGIIKKYPFFQTAYSLFVLNLKNINDPRFKEYLKDYSVYVKDRERLFQHLNILESYYASYFEGIKPSADPPQPEENQEERDVSDTSRENKSTERDNTEKNRKNTRRLQKEKKEFSTEYLRSRIATTLTQQTKEVDKQGQGTNDEMTDFFILDKADELTERVVKNVPKNSRNSQEAETSRGNTKESSSDETFELEESSKSTKKQPKEVKENRYAADQYFPEHVYSPESKENKDLIDKFLENNPEIEKIEPKNQEEKDISENSVQESEDLLTEKLAFLYIKQGYFEKAIEAYQKLSLKYPEKSDYFAQQIERVKHLNGEQ